MKLRLGSMPSNKKKRRPLLNSAIQRVKKLSNRSRRLLKNAMLKNLRPRSNSHVFRACLMHSTKKCLHKEMLNTKFNKLNIAAKQARNKLLRSFLRPSLLLSKSVF
jgi:hypothetical protein